MNRKQRRIIKRAARKHGIKPRTLYGVKVTETGTDSGVGEVSPAGARGPFQFMPATARSYHINPNSFRQSANAAALYLSKSKSKGYGRMLSDYNAGPAGAYQPDYVSAVRSAAKGWNPPKGGGGARKGKPAPPRKRGMQITSSTQRIPGVDNSALRQAARLTYLEERGQPDALVNLVTGLRDAADVPASSKTNWKVKPGGPAKRGHTVPAGAKGAEAVRKIFERADHIDKRHMRYVLGGGHTASTITGPWDCSGAVSRVLRINPLVSGQFASWGKPGKGKHVTIYANSSHVLMSINGRFWGTSGSNPGGGAGWISPGVISKGYLSGFTARHPEGM